MAEKKKQFVKLAVIAVALIVIYAVYSEYTAHKEEIEAEEEAQRLMITDIDTSEVRRVSYTDGDDTFGFSKEDEEWYYEGDRELPLDESCVSSVLSTYSGLSGTRKLDETGNGEDYGFGSPSYEISIEDTEGTVTEVDIGNTADETGAEYYITADGGKTVYTIESSVIDVLVFDVDSLVEYETFPTVTTSNFESLTAVRNGTVLLECKAEDDEDDGDDSESAADIYAKEIGSIYFDICEDYNAEESELEDYGLDKRSRLELTLRYEDNETDESTEIVFFAGDTTEEDGTVYVYIMMEDSCMVYKADASEMENLISL